MNVTNSIMTIDSHAAGEPLRTITSGMPYLKGATMYEKMVDMETNYDDFRKLVMLEPRGHADMLGAVLTPPVNNDSDVGVFYIDTRGYAPMCGAGTLALCKTLIDTGMIKANKDERFKRIKMDTPSGTVTATAICDNGNATHVKFENIDSFLYEENLQMSLSNYGTFSFDIAYGGNFFILVDIENFGIEFDVRNARMLSELGMLILTEANQKYNISHPEIMDITFLNDIMFYKNPDEKNSNYRNLVIFGAGQVDRSPCGTGTCARMAQLYKKGKLNLNEDFVHESIIGTKFIGRILTESTVGNYKSIIPEIEGECSITGFNHFVLDGNDSIKSGFIV